MNYELPISLVVFEDYHPVMSKFAFCSIFSCLRLVIYIHYNSNCHFSANAVNFTHALGSL